MKKDHDWVIFVLIIAFLAWFLYKRKGAEWPFPVNPAASRIASREEAVNSSCRKTSAASSVPLYVPPSFDNNPVRG